MKGKYPMKKYIVIPLVLLLGVLIASCSDNSTNPTPVTETGSVYLVSVPTGASISIDGTATGKVTPDSVTGLSTGSHSVKLSLTGYFDSTFTVTVSANQLTVPSPVTLVSTLSVTPYGPVRIYETAGTNASQPSGLDLSTGMAYGVSSADKDKVDIYYSTTGTGGTPYLVQSADLYPNLTRHTGFYVGSGSDITDGVDSPNSALAGWTDHMSDTESHYVFLYDEDGHYSKLVITNSHQGSGPGDPSWVEVKWEYNNAGADQRF